MKTKYLIPILFFLPFIASAANYKGHISFEVTQLEYSASTVDFTLQVRLTGEIVDKCESKIVMPVIETSRNTYSYPYILISGNNKRHMFNRWQSLKGKDNNRNYIDRYVEIQGSKNKDTLIVYNLQIPKEEWTAGARLILREETYSCAQDISSMDYLVQEGVLREEEKIVPPPVVTIPEPTTPKPLHDYKEVYYHLNRSEIDFAYKSNQSQAQDIVRLINNSNIRITAINITGYASPEGPYKNNENLAMQRAISLKKYIHQHTSLDQELVHINWIPENWKGLLNLLRENDIPNKYGVISIIENNSIPEQERNNYIKLIDNGQTYNRLLRDYYPQLRKVECHIYYESSAGNAAENTDSNLQMKEFLFY